LVHCAAGISRSSTIVIAYLMQAMQFSLTEAFKYVREKRPIISPNDGFSRQLQVYQDILSSNNCATAEQIEFLSGYKKTTSDYAFCFNHMKDKQLQFR